MVEVTQGPDLAYIRSLVRVRAAAGALFFDEHGRVLVVHPAYKDEWELPGGSLESGESPPPAVAAAGRRVVRRDRLSGLIGEYSQAA